MTASPGRTLGPSSFALADAEGDDDGEERPLVGGGSSSSSSKAHGMHGHGVGRQTAMGARMLALAKYAAMAVLLVGVLFGLSKLMANPALIQVGAVHASAS